MTDKPRLINGVDVVAMFKEPRWQRHASATANLEESMRESAGNGLLSFTIHVRNDEVGDGARRLKVLDQWSETGEHDLLRNTWVTVADYTNILKPMDFLSLYDHVNTTAKNHTAGDFVRRYYNRFDEKLQKFANGAAFLKGGKYAEYAKDNGHWVTLFVIQYDPKGGLKLRRNEALAILDSTDQHPTFSAEDTLSLLTRTYDTLLAVKKAGGQFTTAKWAVSLMSSLLKVEAVDAVEARVLRDAWVAHQRNTLQFKEWNRNTTATEDRIKDFIKQLRKEKKLAKAAMNS
jgi:hypothetical protein